MLFSHVRSLIFRPGSVSILHFIRSMAFSGLPGVRPMKFATCRTIERCGLR
jgi:hypothetical protein